MVSGIRAFESSLYETINGGTVASWLVRSTPDQAVRVRALGGHRVVPLSIPGVPMGTGEFNARCNPAMD